jgi:hypothetical protein
MVVVFRERDAGVRSQCCAAFQKKFGKAVTKVEWTENVRRHCLFCCTDHSERTHRTQVCGRDDAIFDRLLQDMHAVMFLFQTSSGSENFRSIWSPRCYRQKRNAATL